jgi:hypothetical protein
MTLVGQGFALIFVEDAGSQVSREGAKGDPRARTMFFVLSALFSISLFKSKQKFENASGVRRPDRFWKICQFWSPKALILAQYLFHC